MALENVQLPEDFIQLARTALSGRPQDIQLLIHRASKKYKEALQITIVTDGPIPARALTPVFFIGDYKAGYYMPGKKANEYHFYLFEFKKLKGKIPVRWGWNNDPPEKREDTGFSIEGSATRS